MRSAALIFLLVICIPLRAGQLKNILLIISDDLNIRIGPYMATGQYTPHLNRLAREGIRFTK